MRFFLVVFFAISLQLNAQERTLTASIEHYLGINGTTEQYSDAVDQLYVMLKQQYQSKQVPDSIWTNLQVEKPKEVNRIKAMLASAYRSHFDHDEIKDMIRFYETPTGRKMITDQSKLTLEDKDKISFFYDSPTGKSIVRESEKLNKMVGEISESWSRGLYLSMTEKLATAGYSL